jgi:hypothetical protein
VQGMIEWSCFEYRTFRITCTRKVVHLPAERKIIE